MNAYLRPLGVTFGLLSAALLVGVSQAQSAVDPAHGDATRGQVLYQACTGCHALDENDVGPRHRGVVGRHAGALPDYNYSEALKASGVVWDSATLDRWLINPQGLVPGTKMFFSLPDAQSRADIIAYLTLQK
jgi:cytochrome c